MPEPLTKLFSFYQPVRAYVLAHKVVSGLVLIVILGGGYYTYSKVTAPSTAPRYVTTTVATGTVIAALTESGQVSATTNVDVQTKASGEVLSVLVTPGTNVFAGQALAYLDPTTAQKAVRDAQANLDSANIALQKLQEPADAVSLTSVQNSLASAQAALVQAHTTGYNDVSSAFLVLPGVITGLDNVLHGYTVRTSEQNENTYVDIGSPYDTAAVTYGSAAESAYLTAYASYTKALADFKATPRNADNATIEALIQETYQAAANVSDALKAATNLLNFTNNILSTHNLTIPPALTSQISSLTSYNNQTNTNVANLSADASAVTSNERSVVAAQASLLKTQTGADPLDVASSNLSVTRAQNALADAQSDLANTVVRAPFTGTVAKISIQKYQNVGSGVSVATMVSAHQSATISLNEVDAAKLAVGQKATLTFDAIPGVTIAGTVASLDSLGTVSQGVVTYGATITFDTDNTSVKPGMSTDASIVTSSKSDVLVVPTSSIKTSNGQTYVQVFTPPLATTGGAQGVQTTLTPENVPVTVGITGDTSTEIVSGVSAGTQVVVRTITGTTAATTGATSATGARGGTNIGGIRIP